MGTLDPHAIKRTTIEACTHSIHSASAALALSSVWLAGPTIALKVQGACPHFKCNTATSLSEVALKVWQAPCTVSASVGPASQTELSASAALALCVLWATTVTVKVPV